MNYFKPKAILTAVVISTLPLTVFADDATTTTATTKQADSFQTICTSSWMKRVDEINDKVGYKNFGEKYCACALTQSLDTDAAVDKAIQVCMSRTLLHDAMDTIEDKIGLAKATDKDIGQSCQDKWSLIYPKMADEAKQTATAFCDCSQPKLVELLKTSENMTDKDYDIQINTIADSCAPTIKPDASAKKPQS